MRIYLARHGQTEWNVIDRKQGRLDSPLTEKGKMSAMNNANVLKNKNIKKIFCSPMGRAKDTAEIIGDILQIKPIIVDGLKEYDYGKWSGLTNDKIKSQFPTDYKNRKLDKYTTPATGGESYISVQERSEKVINKLINENDDDLLIVSHEMIGRTIVANLIRLSPEELLSVSHSHDVIFMFNTENKNMSYLKNNIEKEGYIVK